MATTAEVISQTSSINLISKSISSTRSSLSSTNITVGRIQKIIETKTKVRSDLFFKNQIIERRRREASKRREYEDQIESSKVSTNIQSGLRVASSSGQGPLGRILSFLGYLGAGWILENLPTWIAMGKEFIARMKKAGEIIFSIPNTMWRILQGFGEVLKSVGSNIRNLDFTDSSDKIKDSFTELTDTVDLLGTQIAEGFKLLLQPTGEVEIPSTGEQQPDTLYPQVPTPSPGGGRGFGGSGVSKGVEIARRLQKDLGLRDYQAAAVVGNLLNESSQLNPAQIQNGGSGLLKVDGKTGYGWAQWTDLGRQRKLYQLAQSMGIDPSKQPLTDEVNYAMLISELPEYDSGGRFRASRNIKEASNWLLEQYFRPADRGTREQKERIADGQKILQAIKTTPSTTPQPTAPPRPVSNGIMNLIPQTGAGGFIQGGSGSGRDTAYATHFHIDSKTKNPNTEQRANIREVAFQATKAMFARGSTVYFGNIKQFASKNDSTLKAQILAEQQAHDARSSPGVDIQESNSKVKPTFPSQPGSATKFPFAVGEVYYRGGYGREAEIIGTGGITVSHGAAGSKASQISPQLAKVPSETGLRASTPQQPQILSTTPQQQRQVAEAVSKERMGQQFLFIDDRTASQPSVSVGSQKSYGGSASGQITEFDMLNKFMKQKLLLDFNYL